jgi:hypothetical protein
MLEVKLISPNGKPLRFIADVPIEVVDEDDEIWGQPIIVSVIKGSNKFAEKILSQAVLVIG